MYRKLKNVMSGLAMAIVALVGGAMFGGPAQPHGLDTSVALLAAEPASEPAGVEHSELWIEVNGQGVRIHVAPPAPASDVPPARRHEGAFQMPYFSFGATLPRASSLTES